MHQSIHLLQLVFGGAFALGLLGWCLYRLAILFGIVRKQTKTTRRSPNGNQTGRAGKSVSPKGQKKAVTNLSRRVLYSAKRERD